MSLVAQSRTISVAPQRVSAGYFRVLGVPPAIGREFTAEEDVIGGPALAILSDRIWRSAFNGDPSVVGQSILLKGEPHVVIGVMPAGVHAATSMRICGRRSGRRRRARAAATTTASSRG